MPGTWAILLAAGESRRMGGLKALLPWEGTTLIEHQIASLFEAGVDRIVVVLGHDADRLIPLVEGRENLEWVVNPRYLQGKTTSIKKGLSAVSYRDAAELLILNVDQPRSAETVRCLLERHHEHGRLITIPEFGGKGGHPVIIVARLLSELQSIDEETQGIKAVVRRHAKDVVRVDLEEAEVLWDLNTPEQYQEALKSAGQ
jgi:molybdenum cofactor cytidylyltransferase